MSDKYAADGVDERIDQPLQWVCWPNHHRRCVHLQTCWSWKTKNLTDNKLPESSSGSVSKSAIFRQCAKSCSYYYTTCAINVTKRKILRLHVVSSHSLLTYVCTIAVEEGKMAKKDGYQREKHMTSVFVLFSLCHIGLLTNRFGHAQKPATFKTFNCSTPIFLTVSKFYLPSHYSFNRKFVISKIFCLCKLNCLQLNVTRVMIWLMNLIKKGFNFKNIQLLGNPT